jgi:hypothetical protein
MHYVYIHSSSSSSVANGRRNFRATTDSNNKEMNSKETTNQIVNRIKSEWGGEAVEEVYLCINRLTL